MEVHKVTHETVHRFTCRIETAGHLSTTNLSVCVYTRRGHTETFGFRGVPPFFQTQKDVTKDIA